MARNDRRELREDAFARQGDFNEQLYMALRKSPWWMLSIAGHLLLFFIFAQLKTEVVKEPPKIPVKSMASTEEEPPKQEVDEVQEETEEVQAQEVVAKEPVIKDAPIDDHVETDNDMPFEESMGETEGLSDAPFEGPQSNNLLGTGGGAGGAFKG